MASITTKIGDVFCAKLDKGKKYFQYVANDMTMLNSSVIRVFEKLYPMDASPELKDIVNDKVDFYAHVVLRWGIEMALWEKVGNIPDIGIINVLFRDSHDTGHQIAISENWQIWKINEPFQQVGKLEGENRNAEIGLVISPNNIIDRMKTGKYKFKYPGFE